MSSQWIGRGHFWQMSAISFVVVTIYLTIAWLLVRRHGVYGAVYANLATSGVAILSNGGFAVFCEIRSRRSRVRDIALADAVADSPTRNAGDVS
jgi:hypothetical protein